MQNVDPSSVNLEVPINENFETLEHQAVYGKRHPATTGLIWGYYGGRWGGFEVDDDTITLDDDTDNYIVVEVATGILSFESDDGSPPGTVLWDDDDYLRVYKVSTAGGVVVTVEDHRAGPGGVHGSSGGGGGGSTIGRHEIPISAASMTPSATGGCAPLAKVATASNKPDVVSIDFDKTTQEYAQFKIPMPKSWDEGTISFIPYWSHAAGGSAFGVVWDLQAVALSDGDSINSAYGTAQTSTDTGGTADDMYRGPESAAITAAGTPAAGDMVCFRLSRVTGDGGDTLDIDARLESILLVMTLDADTDA